MEVTRITLQTINGMFPKIPLPSMIINPILCTSTKLWIRYNGYAIRFKHTMYFTKYKSMVLLFNVFNCMEENHFIKSINIKWKSLLGEVTDPIGSRRGFDIKANIAWQARLP